VGSHRAFSGVLAAALTACTLLHPLGEGYSDGEGTPDAGGAADTAVIDAPSLEGAADAPGDTTIDADATPGDRYAGAVIADGPKLYFRFEEAFGTTVVRSAVGSDTGTMTGVNVALGVPGAMPGSKAVAFDVGDSAVRVPASAALEFDGMKPFSVELWFNQSASTGSLGFLVDHEDWETVRRGWNVIGGDGLIFERRASASSHNAAGASLTVGTWHHAVAVMDASAPPTMHLYVDGVLRASNPATVSVGVAGVPFMIGKQSCTPCAGNSFHGSVDELAIYDKALTPAQVATHYELR